MNSRSVLVVFSVVTTAIGVRMGSWMNLGLQSSKMLNPEAYLLGTTLPLCQQISGLSNGQQKLCMLYTDHMMHVGRGARRGIAECKFQFNERKWNCSTVEDSTVFGPILSIPSKEAAFANAIASAGVVLSIARGCRDGQLDSCGCSSAGRPDDLKGEWIWGGCGDNIHYGYKFAKNFVDIREREVNERRGSDNHGRQLMNVHNNEAGRRAVIKNMKVTCKCHGVSGSCSLVTCWQQLAPFRKVGDYLREKYDTSTMVKVTRRGRLRVRNGRDTIPTANDLVYLGQSPDYCQANATIGTLGTQGRTCTRFNEGKKRQSRRGGSGGKKLEDDEEGSCGVMCCNRGYETIIMSVKERCNCKFHWCCYVECQTCEKDIKLNVCK